MTRNVFVKIGSFICYDSQWGNMTAFLRKVNEEHSDFLIYYPSLPGEVCPKCIWFLCNLKTDGHMRIP